MARRNQSAAAPAPEAEVPAMQPAEQAAAAPEAAAPAKAEKASVTVKYRDHAGFVTERVFSKEVHGNNFAALAEEFKATNAKQCDGLNG